MNLVGISSFGDVLGQAGGVSAAATSFATASATATAAAAAVTPPGNDLDSARATAQQGVTTANFISVLGMGIEQLAERAAETTTDTVTQQALQAFGAAAVLA
ncbi:Uncharacterised protein (plasmid) [Tsukamurella tyrosinosolvens]|uniref:Uncharacterized protein n=1 Tax=Tsukamurella tyrosinosolvens TaxID=57704 RepID=A0A1H4VIH2_TSUTY|nr:hypothetical protein [Tsukamurella tyrosinosolvens]KXO90978.1 hypothetical protein AXK58_21340 [Tsukamurella tyrosinosolvens]SEC80271.1 hypothetical protein SAMN04489793_3226 [Tsukamurella tyrosinosolvens]VEH90522.1 Uncharacterised protein [Tsukamurella tyrosinosolvens]